MRYYEIHLILLKKLSKNASLNTLKFSKIRMTQQFVLKNE